MSAVAVARFNLNGSPVAAGSSENDFIGSVASLSLSFLNSSPTEPGYVPFIDLTLPATANGLSFANATYLGQAVIAQTLTFDASGHATHPFLKDASGSEIVLSGPPGGKLVVLTLPFGSFAPGQTPADIVVNLNVSSSALVNSPLDVTATPGFAFGNSPTGVTAANPPILGVTTDFNVVPQVVTLKTVYVGPERETATGPSYPRAWDSVATIAPGQTLTQLVLTQKLPDGAVFLPGSSTLLYGTGAAIYGATDPNGTITYDAATNTVTGTFSVPVTGGVAGSKPTLQAGFYVTSNYALPANGTTILDPSTGAFAPLADTSNLTANWASSNPLNPKVLTPAPATDIITAKSIAIQKGVTDLTHGQAAYQPNDTLQYSLAGQVSNYFDLNALVITDTLGDGQTFKTGFTPTISITDLGQTLYSGVISASEYSVSTKAIDGTSVVTFNVSQILADHGKPTDLNGGTALNPAQATADIIFDTTIDPTYSATPAPSVSKLVDQGDSIGNTVVFTGNVVSTGKTISDNSSASITLPTNTVSKTIYAVNGVKVTGPVTIQAGDLVTYDLTMATPLTSTHLVSLTDFLPLPTFHSTDPGANGGVGGFTFSNTTSATPPAVGVAEFGPADTFHAAVPGDVPTITTNATSNSLTFKFGDYTKGTTQYPGNVADILYTVRAGDQAFADGLLLTNQVTESETNSFGVVSKQNAIVQLTLGEPVLKIEKAVVATSNTAAVFSGNRGPDTYSAPGTLATRFSGGVISGAALAANPLGDSLSGIVAGDAVTFAVVVENTGSGPDGAFDVILHDTIPTGFNAPTNIRVTDGAGNLLSYTNIGGGLFDPAGGIELTDKGAKGSLATYDATTGKNVVVITYDATASVNVPVPNYDLRNVATLTNYAAEQGGTSHVAVTPVGDLVAASDVYTAKPLFAKAVIATSNPAPTAAANNLHDLAIGATATYDITLTLTKGTAGNVSITDLLPSGAGGQLDFLSATVKSIGVDISGSALTVGASANGTGGAFNFGTLTDGFNTQGGADQIVVEVTARATSIPVNKGGESVVNTATLSETDPNNPSGAPYIQTATAAELLVEPELKLTKTASSATAQANDIVTYTLSFTNQNNANSAAAYDAAIADTLSQLAPNAVFQAGSVKVLASSTAAATIVTGNHAGDTGVLVNVAEIDPGQVVNVIFTAKLIATALDNATINNTATVTADTLPGRNPAERVESTSGSAKVVVGPASIVKTLISGSDGNIAAPKLTAGETGTYKVVVTLPHGRTASLSVADAMPANLLYAGSATVTIGSNVSAVGGGTVPFTITMNAGNPTFNFGTVQDTGTGASTGSDQIVILYNAVVAPTAANANGVKDTNTATLLTDGTALGTSAVTANIVAPLLTLAKTANLNGALPEAGSDVTYTLTLAQTGTSPAYGINLVDLLPADVTYDPGSVTASGNAIASVSGHTLTVTDAQLLVGDAPVTVTYRAHLNNTVTPGEKVTNYAAVNYNSEPTGGFAEATVSASAIVAIDLKPTEVKTIIGLSNSFSASNVITGETITYKLLTTLQDGTQHFRLADNLPSGLTFISANVASVGAGITGLSAGAITPTAGTFDFGTVVAVAGTGTADQVEVDIVAAVAHSSGVANFTNSATALTSAPGSTTIGLEVSVANAPTLTQVYSSLSGNVFTDNNDDGVKLGADAGLSGVTVKLLESSGSATGVTTTTDASGNYSFTGLNVGTYSVQVVPPSADAISPVGANANPAWNSIVNGVGKTASVTLLPGANTPNQNAGLYVPVSISGNVFGDLNADGVAEAGDAGLTSVTVSLIGADGHTVIWTTTTDASGNYKFTGLTPGTYNVSVAQPAGQTFSPTGSSVALPDSVVNSAGAIAPVTLTSGQSATNQNAGLYGPGSLSGKVFTDNNDDGVLDTADAGLGGVVVKLLTSAGVPTGAFTTTASDGTYSFAGLHPGSYEVLVVAPGTDGFSPVGTNASPALDSIVNLTGSTPPAIVNSNTNTPNQNAGVYVPASISGTVFTDNNADGVKQPGDAGLAGQTVKLIGSDGQTILATTTTAPNGTYSFTGLKPASYSVTVIGPNGDTFSQVGTSPTLPDSIVNAAGGSGTITLTSGLAVINRNAGVYAPATLTGNVFGDTNSDGAHQAGEGNLASVQVRLLDGSGNPIPGKTATTDANGNYSFTGLKPGSYAVAITPPANDTFSPSGTSPTLPDSTVGANGVTPTVTLTSGQTANQISGLYLPTPRLTVAKSADVSLTDGGHVVTYTVVLSQAPSSTGSAYKVTLGDLLAPGETLVANSATATAGTITSTGGQVAFTDPVFALGATPITITYNAQVKGDVVGGQQIINTANLAYSSLPANGTSFTGTSTATVGVQLLDGIAKSVVGAPLAQSSNLAPGGSVTFDVTATLDTGAQALTISDLLPAGLTYVSSKLDSLGGVTGSSLAVGASGSYNAATGTVSFNLGDVDTPIGASSNQVMIEVTATVAAGATIGSTLTNIGKLVSATPTNGYGVSAGTPHQSLTAIAPILVVAPASITGNAFLDSHCDGSDDYGDPAFKGVVVKLYDGLGNFTGLTSVTDASGGYSFGNLAPGKYQLHYVLPTGTKFTDGTPGTDSHVNPLTGFSPIFTLVAGKTETGHDVGLELTGGYANGPTVQLDATHTANNYTYTPTGTNIVVGGSGTQSDRIFGGGGNNILIGGMGANVIEGGYGTNLILGGCGPFAQIQSLGTNDFVFGGTGDDLIQAHSGNAFVAAGPGNQTLVNTGATDTFIAGTNRGTITYAGGTFSNIAVGDTFQTGANTTSIYEKGDGVLYINDYDPSRGDTLKIYGYGAPAAIGQAGIYEVLYFGPNAAVLLRATSGVLANPSLGVTYSAALPTAPLLTVSIDANNFLTLTTAASTTPVIGQHAQLPVVVPPVAVPPVPNVGLSQSSPTYTGGDTPTNVTGPGYDTVTLGNGNNTVTLGGYGNTVTVGNGDNVIDMGLGNDTVVAGNGHNAIKADGYGNTATVGSGTDTINIGLSATIHAAGGNQTIQLDGYSNMVFIGGAGASVITGGVGNSHITTTGGSAIITLGGYSNVVTTGAANDTIADGTGYTKFVVGTTQVGQANGTETISGFAANAGSVIDFVPLAANGQSAAQLFASLHANAGGNAEIDFLNGGSVIFQGLAPSQLHLANFQVG